MSFARLVGQDARPHLWLTHLRHPLIQWQVRDLLITRVQHERVGRQFQTDHQADRPGENLRGDLSAGGVELLDQVHRTGPNRIAGVAGRQGEGDGHVCVARGLEHLLQDALVATGWYVRDELQQAAAGVGNAADDCRDLGVSRIVGRDGCAAAGLVESESRRRNPQRPNVDRLGCQLAHQREILSRGRLAVCSAFAHHIYPQRGVR